MEFHDKTRLEHHQAMLSYPNVKSPLEIDHSIDEELYETPPSSPKSLPRTQTLDQISVSHPIQNVVSTNEKIHKSPGYDKHPATSVLKHNHYTILPSLTGLYERRNIKKQMLRLQSLEEVATEILVNQVADRDTKVRELHAYIYK